MATRVAVVTSIQGAPQVANALKSWETGLNRIGRAANENAREMKKVTDQGNRLTTLIRGPLTAALGGLTAAFGVRELVRTADTYTLIESRLRLVTFGTQNLLSVQRQLFQQSQDTRISFEATAELYTRLARATRDLGATQDETLTVTRAINQAVIVSGASAAEAQAGLIQFAQGLASGALRGDELRSVLEQLPRLAEAIATGLGVTVGELRELGAEGELAADKVFEAILKTAPQIEAEFGQIDVTVGQSLTNLGNSLGNIVSKLDDITGASAGLAGAFQSISEFLDGFADPTPSERLQELNDEIAILQERLLTLAPGANAFDRLSTQFSAILNDAEEIQTRINQLDQERRELLRLQQFEEQSARETSVRQAQEAEQRKLEAAQRRVEAELKEQEKLFAQARRLAEQELNFQVQIGEVTLEQKIEVLQNELEFNERSAAERLRLEQEIARSFQQLAAERIEILKQETQIELAELKARLGNTQEFIDEKKALLTNLNEELSQLAQDLESQSRLAGAAVADVGDEVRRTEAAAESSFTTVGTRIDFLGTIGQRSAGILADAFNGAFGQITQGSLAFGRLFGQVFSSVVDSVLAQFARLAADKVFQILFGTVESGDIGRAAVSSPGGLTGGFGSTGLFGAVGVGGGAAAAFAGLLPLALGIASLDPGTAVGSILGTALGAFIGTFIFPGLGTLAGAAIGGSAGGFIGGLFQTGGSKVITSPQLIGVGEVGPERVTVEPLAGAPAGSRGGVTLVLNGPTVFDEVTMQGFIRMVELAVNRTGNRIV